MFPTFSAVFNLIRKNLFPILFGIIVYFLCLFVLFIISFGDLWRIPDDFSTMVLSSLGIGPPSGIFTLLNFPFIFPFGQLPIPIFLGGIYYSLMAVAVWKVIRQRERFRQFLLPRKLWHRLLFQKSVWLGGLLQIIVSLIAPVANLPFFIIGMLAAWGIKSIYGDAPGSGLDGYWIIPLFFLTAFVQGAYYGYLYAIAASSESACSVQREKRIDS